MEEWALRLHILHAPEDIQLKELYNNDSETQHRVDKVIASKKEKSQKMFHITNTPLPYIKHTTDTNTNNEEIDGLNTNTDQNKNLSNYNLEAMVNRVLIESLEKAEKKKNTTTKHSIKEIENMKKIYNAASTFTMIMNKLLQMSGGYNNFEEMNDDILYQINLSGKELEQTPQVNKKHKQSKSSDSEYEPPNKKEEIKYFIINAQIL